MILLYILNQRNEKPFKWYQNIPYFKIQDHFLFVKITNFLEKIPSFTKKYFLVRLFSFNFWDFPIFCITWRCSSNKWWDFFKTLVLKDFLWKRGFYWKYIKSRETIYFWLKTNFLPKNRNLLNILNFMLLLNYFYNICVHIFHFFLTLLNAFF